MLSQPLSPQASSLNARSISAPKKDALRNKDKKRPLFLSGVDPSKFVQNCKRK